MRQSSIHRFCKLLFLGLFCMPAAVLAEAPVDLQRPIITEVYEPAVEDDTAALLPAVLVAFREQPDDLQVVTDLNKNSATILAYTEQRMASDAPPLSSDAAGELMVALSLINDERALNTLLALAERYNRNTEMSQAVLLMLRDMPVTEPVLAYVDKLVETNRTASASPGLVRSALLYYLAVKHSAGMRWAAVYRSPGIDPQLRFAGLALAASLVKDDQVTRWLLAELTKQPPVARYQQYYLLAGLYASITEAEFDTLLPRFSVTPTVVKDFQRLRDFNRADETEKNKLAGFMLVSPYLDQQQTALTYFLQQHTMLEVWPRLDVTRRLSAIRLSHSLGISILPEPEVSNESVPARTGVSPVYVLGLILLGVFVGAFFYRRVWTAQRLKKI